MLKTFAIISIFLAMAFTSFSQGVQSKGKQWRIERIDTPAGSGTSQPNLTVGKGRVYLNWFASDAKGQHALKFAEWDGKKWSPANSIVANVPFFVNWADFPSMFVNDGVIAAHWLEKSGQGVYAYDVKVSVSKDGGKTWGAGLIPHTDRSKDEHGFVSFVDRGSGRFSAMWLDARNNKMEMGSGEHPAGGMMLMAADYVNGTFTNERVIDSRVCDCCQTAAAPTKDGMFVAYRDRSESEIRDIAYARYHNGKWSSPRTLHADGWHIPGCPVNGPSVSVSGNKVAVAWFSAAKDQPRVLVIISQDGGQTFGAPIRIDQGTPNGRVDLEFLRDDSLVVSWLEHVGDGAEIRMRRVRAGGQLDPFLTIAAAVESPASGFPRISRFGDDILIAWTEAAQTSQVRMARLTQR